MLQDLWASNRKLSVADPGGLPQALRSAAAEGSLMKSRALSALMLTLVSGAALAHQSPPQTLPNGLQRVHTDRFELAYMRKGTDWTKYKTILLKPLVVPPSARNTAPDGTAPPFGESYLLTGDDVATLQKLFADSFHKVLGNAGYTFVTTPQPGTLVVMPQIVKILLNAPVANTRDTYAGMDYTVTEGGGSITMEGVLADGTTNVVLAEVLDRKYGSNMWELNNRVTNLAEARDIFDQWAHDLKARLASH